MAPKTDIYSKVTDSIIETMEKGFIPWEKDWKLSGMPKNRVSKRPYSGINFLILSMSPYGCEQWLTFKQAKALGGSVRKGEKGTTVVFYKKIQKKDENNENKTFSVLKNYTVFNVEQCDDIEPLSSIKNEFCGPMAYIHHIEAIRAHHDITVKHGNPAYHTTGDFVLLPKLSEFDSEIAYCQSAAHEFVHWTGHISRHDRFTHFDESLKTKNELYAAEELVAELGAAMICADIGIHSITTHAAYLQGWLKALKNDKKYIFQAAAKANKAVALLQEHPQEHEEIAA